MLEFESLRAELKSLTFTESVKFQGFKADVFRMAVFCTFTLCAFNVDARRQLSRNL